MKIKDMNSDQRRVFDACYNGWFVSGQYAAMFDNHRREFCADSKKILFNDVDKWFTSHEENHADAHLLVKCVKAA